MPQVDASRSVLFATLATQAELITPSQAARAMETWTGDPSRSIAEVLAAQGALDPGAMAVAESLVQAHLSRHDDDPSRTLAALTRLGPLLSDLRRIEDTEPQSERSMSVLLDRTGPEGPDSHATLPETFSTGDGASVAVPGASAVGPRFRILRSHARGGLGEVFVAHDAELDREVALKEIRLRFADDPMSRARFLLEAKITGNLEHPGIVPVYGLGCYADGRPYYAMRFVRGETLWDAIERFHRGESRPTSAGDRAVAMRKLIVRFLAVCDALDYAHSRGVIHRDLKPSNILLGPHGETLVVDWGLAKPIGTVGPEETASTSTGGEAAEGPNGDETVEHVPAPLRPQGSGSTDPTRPGSTVGTPQYMPPEQARGELEKLGSTSDVYSLGATLYAVLTGYPPVDFNERNPNPATLLDRVRAGRIVPARTRDRTIDPALAAICEKAMAFEASDRYPTARALAEDLERWLADEPVSARREPMAARLGRWARRHKPWVVGAATSLLVALVSLGFVAKARLDRQAARLDRKAALAEARSSALEAHAARRAEQLQRYYALIDRLRQRVADPRPGWTWEARDELRRAATLQVEIGRDEATTIRTLAASALSAIDFRPAPPLSPGLNPSCVAFSPDGRIAALGEFKAQAYLSCSVALLDWNTGSVVQRLAFSPSIPFQIRSRVQDGARRIAFGPEGRWLAVGTRSGRVHCWDLSRNEPLALSWEAHADEVLGLAFAAGGDVPVLYSSAGDGRLHRWRFGRDDQAPGDPTGTFKAGGPIRALAHHGTAGLACLADGRLYRLDPVALTPREPAPEIDGNQLAWHPDGRIMAVGHWDAITLVSVESGRVLHRLTDPAITTAHHASLSSLRFHPDGSILASASSADHDRRIKLWDVATGRLVGSYHDASGAGYAPIDVAFHPQGGHLVATGHDRANRLELSPHPAYDSVALDETTVRALALSPDGETLARLGRSHESLPVGLWSVSTRDRRARFEVPDVAAPPREEYGLAFDPTGDRLAISGSASKIEIRNVGSDSPPTTIEAPTPASVQFSHDGHRLWARTDIGHAIVGWDLASGAPVARWSDPLAAILRGLDTLTSLAVAEPRVLVGGRDGLTRLLRRENDALTLLRQWDHNAGPVRALAVQPGADRAVAGTLGGSIVLLLLSDGDGGPIATVADAHPDGVSRLAINPDGRTLASGGLDRAVRLWTIDGSTLRPIATLGVASGPILNLGFTSDGLALAVAAEGEYAVRLWRLDWLGDRWSDLHLTP